MYHIAYNNKDNEALILLDENWCYSNYLVGLLSSVFRLQVNEQSLLCKMINVPRNKLFLRYQAQKVPFYLMINGYEEKDAVFVKTVINIHIFRIQKDADIISSHVICKLQFNDDMDLSLKTRIVPHRNENSLKGELKTDCCFCPPAVVCVVLSISCMKK